MKKFFRFCVKTIVFFFLLFNVFCIIHAYKFTHFNEELAPIYKPPKQISTQLLVQYLLTGIDIPKPKLQQKANLPFIEKKILSDVQLSSWYTYRNKSKGTVILCHGYGTEKSSLNNVAKYFYGLGYNTLQFDFRGAGDSEGNQVTIGYKEAQNVIDVCRSILDKNPKEPIILYGASMGAVAIIKAMSESPMPEVKALILECPFGTMQETVAARFRLYGVPEQPFVPFLVFWGGLINGFNGFGLKPVDYAKNIKIPTLLLVGDKDPFVSVSETEQIYNNFAGPKHIKVINGAVHENYYQKFSGIWTSQVSPILKKYNK